MDLVGDLVWICIFKFKIREKLIVRGIIFFYVLIFGEFVQSFVESFFFISDFLSILFYFV